MEGDKQWMTINTLFIVCWLISNNKVLIDRKTNICGLRKKTCNFNHEVNQRLLRKDDIVNNLLSNHRVLHLQALFKFL